MTRRFVLPPRAEARLEVDFEKDLNEQQLAVVSCGEGPKLVIAGAGSGKTRTLTYRTAYLLARGVAPHRILLVTFTNKAAREMLARVARLTGLEPHRMWGGTFHAVGARILRRHAELLAYEESFSILDEADQRDLLRLCVTDVGVQVEQRRFPSPRILAGMLSLAANTRLPLDDLIADRYGRFLDWSDAIQRVAQRYGERKHAANAMDYDDLLLLWLRLLREHEPVRRRYTEQFRHILVDEYQDTNLVQGELVEAVAEGAGNLMVVGDDSQSIYAFRGANYDNILRFPERNPGTEVFKLEINYRSTPQILAVTNASIRHNRDQYEKTLAARRPDGMLPALVPCSYPDQEATFVAERILQLRDEGIDLADIAVLYRAHAHRLAVETTFLRYDIPYEVRGGLRFFEQAHIKDVVAHLRVIANPRDEVAFRRVLLLQTGIGNVTADRVWKQLGQGGEPQRGGGAGPEVGPPPARQTDEPEPSDGVAADTLIERLDRRAVRSLLSGRARPGWDAFIAMLRAVRAATADPEHAIRAVLASGYEECAAGKFDNFESRMEDLEQLAIFAAQYASIRELLEELLLLGELYGQDVSRGRRGDDEAAVILSTIHQAKGLEWSVVFVIHLVEAMFPSPRALDEPGGEEEERRIFYVAMTRARDELYLCYPIVRPGGYGASLVQQASRFVQELPEELYEVWQLEEAGADVELSRRLTGDRDPNVDPLWDDDPAVDEPWRDEDTVH